MAFTQTGFLGFVLDQYSWQRNGQVLKTFQKQISKLIEVTPTVEYSLIEIIAKKIIFTSREYFKTGGPKGSKWKKNVDATILWKEHTQVLVGKTAKLANSVKVLSVSRTKNPKAKVGTKNILARMHETGDHPLKDFFPARPFLSPAVMETVRNKALFSRMKEFAVKEYQLLVVAGKQRRLASKVFFEQNKDLAEKGPRITVRRALKQHGINRGSSSRRSSGSKNRRGGKKRRVIE